MIVPDGNGDIVNDQSNGIKFFFKSIQYTCQNFLRFFTQQKVDFTPFCIPHLRPYFFSSLCPISVLYGMT